MTATDDTRIVGSFEWIPADENGATMPCARPKLSGFAYVDPRRHVEGATLLHGALPDRAGTAATVEGTWLHGYPVLDTNLGDAIVLAASQRPIARVSVTEVRTRTPAGAEAS